MGMEIAREGLALFGIQAVGPAPQEHNVVFTTLHFDQPWTYENYLKAGGYQGSLTLTDMAPLANSRTWPVSLTIIGISVAEDMQKVSLATEAGAYEFEPGLGTQIRLPNGMRLYLTGSMRG